MERIGMKVQKFDDAGNMISESVAEAFVIESAEDLQKLFDTVEAGRDPFAEEEAFEAQHSDGAFFEPRDIYREMREPARAARRAEELKGAAILRNYKEAK